VRTAATALSPRGSIIGKLTYALDGLASCKCIINSGRFANDCDFLSGGTCYILSCVIAQFPTVAVIAGIQCGWIWGTMIIWTAAGWHGAWQDLRRVRGKETADPASLVAKPVSRIAKKAARQMLNRTRLVQMSMYAKRRRNTAGFFVAWGQPVACSSQPVTYWFAGSCRWTIPHPVDRLSVCSSASDNVDIGIQKICGSLPRGRSHVSKIGVSIIPPSLWRSALSARVPECLKLKMYVRSGWHWALLSVTIWHHCTLKG